VSVLHIADVISEKVGRIVSWLLVPMTGVLVYAVILRYVFNSPAIWAHETGLFMYATLGLLAGAYTQVSKGHIRIDVLSDLFSSRKRALIEVITYLLFFFPFCALVGWFGFKATLRSFVMMEFSASVWAPILWPIKMLIPIAIFLLLLQGLADFTRQLYRLSGKNL